MIITSLAAAAVVGVLTAGNVPTQPTWATNYGSALTLAAEQHKPVAVFITNGGMNHLTKGELGTDASKTLSTHYIAVQIDATTEGGKKMADAFGISEGVVISDRTGELMALRHEGSVEPTALTEYLTKYSAQTTVKATEYHSINAPVAQPIAAPVFQPVAAPVYQPVMFPAAGGCASGRCPNAQPTYQYIR